MTKRRSRGDGGLHWDEARQRWIATVTVGYTPAGKRIVRKASGKTKTEANNALRQKIREYEDGLSIAHTGFTVGDALADWLAYGLSGKSANTIGNYTVLSFLKDRGRVNLRRSDCCDRFGCIPAQCAQTPVRGRGQDSTGGRPRGAGLGLDADPVRRRIGAPGGFGMKSCGWPCSSPSDMDGWQRGRSPVAGHSFALRVMGMKWYGRGQAGSITCGRPRSDEGSDSKRPRAWPRRA